MEKQKIIKEVISIILQHAKPERIYLFGSQINGEATDKSDIDIAYDDKNCKDNSLIEDKINELSTLLKIDVKNLAFTDDRFRNRVKDTGKVIYSANKKLRIEDALYNFSKAYKRFSDIVDRQDEFKKEGYDDIYLDLIVKRFEFTYEMSWKTIKRYLDHIGIDARNPRACFKEAYAQDLINEENIWLDMIEMRNLSTHIYDEYEIKGILDKIKNYKDAFSDLIKIIKVKITNEE